MMTMEQSLKFLRSRLVGEQFRFAISAPGAPFTFAAAPLHADLFASLPEDVRWIVGVGRVSASGPLELSSVFASAEVLAHLADGVRNGLADLETLRNLVGAVMLEIAPTGGVLARFEEEHRWSGLPRPQFRGTTGYTARALSKLSPERPVWFWMTDQARHGKPHLIIDSQKDMIEESTFQRASAAMVGKGEAFFGKMRILNGEIILLTQKPAAPIAKILQTFIAQVSSTDELHRLEGARVVQLDGTTPISVAVVGSVDSAIAATSRALESLTPSQKLYFWFSKSGLTVDADKTSLARRMGKGGVRGILGIREERVVISVRKVKPEFLPSLSEWVETNVAEWPALQRLRNPTLSQRA